jgi:hypothetical protein
MLVDILKEVRLGCESAGFDLGKIPLSLEA